MAPLTPPLRLATEADGPVLAALLEAASHGLASHAWRLMAEEDKDPWELGAERQAARARAGDWIVADEGGGPVAALLAVPPDTSGTADPSIPLVFHPLVALEAMEPGALYVNVVAALPVARGRGLGTLLMRHAEAMARATGRDRTSLIVADVNTGARRLYERLGYRRRAALPMVKEGWTGAGTDWILMVRELD
jgi:ribosomal protein S18 acetylase RimI-like enzyme